MKTTPCKACGQPMLFVQTLHGNLQPLSVESKEKRYVIETVGDRLIGSLQDTYISHFADCPEADRFRKGKNDERLNES